MDAIAANAVPIHERSVCDLRHETMYSLDSILGDSPSHFASLYGVSDANRTFEFLRAHEELAMICLNDDETEAASEQIGLLQHDWLESRWPERVWWERLT